MDTAVGLQRSTDEVAPQAPGKPRFPCGIGNAKEKKERAKEKRQRNNEKIWFWGEKNQKTKKRPGNNRKKPGPASQTLAKLASRLYSLLEKKRKNDLVIKEWRQEMITREQEEKKRLGFEDQAAGSFWMTLKDWVDEFELLTICALPGMDLEDEDGNFTEEYAGTPVFSK